MLLSLLLLLMYEACNYIIHVASHRRSSSTKIMTKYGDVGVSPSIVPLCIGIFCV